MDIDESEDMDVSQDPWGSTTADSDKQMDETDDSMQLFYQSASPSTSMLSSPIDVSIVGTSSSTKNTGGLKTIRKLDSETASAIRKCQIITKTSDVVRELVENAADSGANRIQLLMENFGLKKIEVRDDGHGISPSELSKAVAGGYTSKLLDTNHLSSHNQYGFRGEALSSICSIAKVCITTRTSSDLQAKKFMLNNKSEIVSESVTAGNNGTIVIVENIFENFPVRKRLLQQKSKSTAELKDIETFLKCVAIANPQIHISFYHNSSMIWNKASVSSMDQAITTVIGYPISKNLVKCGGSIIVPNDEAPRQIDAFFLKKPIDMRTMSFTSNKWTFIFVNRKRVFIREFEKMIQQYTVATLLKPAPADRRRFPVSVLSIRLPPEDVDFNREMDKSKIFLVHKEHIASKLEELLQIFYGITSLEEEAVATTSGKFQKSAADQLTDSEDDKARRDTVESFLSSIPVVSVGNFSQSPVKKCTEFIRSPFKNTDRNVPMSTTLNILEQKEDSESTKLRQPPSPSNLTTAKSNFDINFDDLLMDTPPEKVIIELELEGDKDPEKQKEDQPVVMSLNEWVQGRVPGSNGGFMQSVNILKQNAPEPINILDTSAVTPRNNKSAYDIIGNGLPSKRPRLEFDTQHFGSYATATPRNQLGISVNSKGRQVTLDHFKNWDTTPAKQKSGYSFGESGVQRNLNQKTPVLNRTASSASFNSINISKMDGPRISIANYLNKPRPQELSADEETERAGRIIGALPKSNLYAAKINNILGIFNPMNMLFEFPSLRYDLNISMEKSPETVLELGAEYAVSKECVPRLFNNFVRLSNSSSRKYPKIFQEMGHLNEIMKETQMNSWHDSQRPITLFQT